MINEINQALKQLIRKEILGHPDLEILFEHPPEQLERSEAEILNIYLHEVTENTALRQDPFQVVRKPGESQGTRKRPFVRMNLVYVVTAQAATTAMEHELLTLGLAALLRNPIIPNHFFAEQTLPMDPIVSVAQPQRDAIEQAHLSLWRALGRTVRPSLTLHVVAPFDPFKSDPINLVREMIVGMGFMHDGSESGRPHDVRGFRVSIAGMVFDENFAPLPGVAVGVANRIESAVSDERGFFYLVNLLPGDCHLVFHRRGYANHEIRVQASSSGKTNEIEPLVIQLKRLSAEEDAQAEKLLAAMDPMAPLVDTERAYPATVAGRLVKPDGQPAAYVPVRLGDQRSVTDLEGRYRFYSREDSDTVWATYPGMGEIKVEIARSEGIIRTL